MSTLEEEYERIGPAPADDPLARLEHTLRAYEDTPDDEHVVTATFNVYGNKVWTGITWGDLRALAAGAHAMVERAAEALCKVDARHVEGLAQGDTDEDHAAIFARAALSAAFREQQNGGSA